MSNFIQENICIIHQLQIVAANLDPNSDCQSRQYCSKCLVEKTNDGTLFINSEVQEHIEEIRNNFLEKKRIYLKNNIMVLEHVQNIVLTLKSSFQQAFDKIFENLSTEKIRLQYQFHLLEKSLNEVDINNFSQIKFKSEENVSQIENFKFYIRASLEQIKNNLSLQQCIQEIENLKEEEEELKFCREFNFEELNIIATPSLKIVCQEHMKQIIAFDMNNNRAKENRMACIHCIEQNPNQYTSLKTVQEKWKMFEEFKRLKFQEIVSQYIQNKDQIFEQLQIINEAHEEMNNQIKQNLNDFHSKLNEQIEQIFSQMGKNWANCPKKKILNKIQKLIKPTYKEEFSIKIQKYYSNQEQSINQNIFDSIQKIRETFKESFYLITKMIKIKSNLQIKKKEIQFSQKIQSTQPLFSFHNQIINFKQSLKIPSKLCVQKKIIELSSQITKHQLNINKKEISMSLKMTVQPKLQIKLNQIQIQEFQKNFKFKYDILPAENRQQNENCYALALGQLFMIAGCGSKLSSFCFNDGKLKNLIQLDKHSSDIKAITFISFNQFVSGDSKGQLYFWKYEINWNNYFEILNEHTDQINQIISSQISDQIITCSYDKTIKVFGKLISTNKWVCQQTLLNHNSIVNAISLNSTETMLISCSSDKKLLVFKKTQIFICIQTINVEDQIYRLTFIKEQSFCIQIQSGYQLHFYDLDKQKQIFQQTSAVEIQNQKSCSQGFPLIFQKDRSLIVSKHGTYINIINKMNNGDYRTEQSINFDTMYLYGTLSSDGIFLVTWDYKTKQFQVRKLIDK
ncbi:unnamed protein product [Paramecium sonneborni]|uniref:WD domain, G-beta repeat protein n=1 Tax=Paramecium sonneborni TaxID=65129 RepID=A0A8S1QV12_9CILI|nr:unnamed protein product [Paramecium sonneborni]